MPVLQSRQFDNNSVESLSDLLQAMLNNPSVSQQMKQQQLQAQEAVSSSPSAELLAALMKQLHTAQPPIQLSGNQTSTSEGFGGPTGLAVPFGVDAVQHSNLSLGNLTAAQQTAWNEFGRQQAKTKSWLYKTELCRTWQQTGSCPLGPRCLFAHGQQELRPRIRHPCYKTKLCSMWVKTNTCIFGNKCNFAHGPHELVNTPVSTVGVELKQYRQQICQSFARTGSCPYGKNCRLIHALPGSFGQQGDEDTLGEQLTRQLSQHHDLHFSEVSSLSDSDASALYSQGSAGLLPETHNTLMKANSLPLTSAQQQVLSAALDGQSSKAEQLSALQLSELEPLQALISQLFEESNELPLSSMGLPVQPGQTSSCMPPASSWTLQTQYSMDSSRPDTSQDDSSARWTSPVSEKDSSISGKEFAHGLSGLLAAGVVSTPPPSTPDTLLAAGKEGVTEDGQSSKLGVTASMHRALLCPLTGKVMKDPVVIESGLLFERSAIEEWFANGKGTCPVSGSQLSTNMIFPCVPLREVIKVLLEDENVQGQTAVFEDNSA